VLDHVAVILAKALFVVMPAKVGIQALNVSRAMRATQRLCAGAERTLNEKAAQGRLLLFKA